ncbi:MAG: phosphoribosylformylglycinamidine synthase subunit PurQ [Candidatus Kapabacteria bacterium]|nr:phosphoribosylformylglycinamidine synthase subunit PurQ [Candidatus Kapabacteria bacterium]
MSISDFSNVHFGIVRFPGSNCDNDALYATSYNLGAQSQFLWHKDSTIPDGIDVIVLPGGFSYGDYLRSGAIARFSPLMKAVVDFAYNGGYVIGICNGFQILTEAGLLPGALGRNSHQLFRCRTVTMRVENTDTAFTSAYSHKQVLSIPIAHGDGNYYADAETIASLEANRQVVLRYVNSNGEEDDASNPNGSINNIAGIINERGNVFGMMPHPERVCDALVGGTDGLGIFQSLANTVMATHVA